MYRKQFAYVVWFGSEINFGHYHERLRVGDIMVGVFACI